MTLHAVSVWCLCFSYEFIMTSGDKIRNDEESDDSEFESHRTLEHAVSIAESADLSISEIDPDEMGADGVMFKTLVQRKSNLAKTAEILATHDVVVQKLINKARDDLGEYDDNFDAIRK